MTTYEEQLICVPCSIQDNKPYTLANKKHNVEVHSRSTLHKRNAEAHAGKAFEGPVQGRIPELIEDAKLVAMNQKKQQMAVLVHLLLRKRPVIEYVCCLLCMTTAAC